MLLGDSVIVIVVGLILIGIIGFFVMLVALGVRFIGFVVRAVSGAGRTEPRKRPLSGKRGDPCPHPRCGHANRPGARYCARCGRSLHQPNTVDAYG